MQTMLSKNFLFFFFDLIIATLLETIVWKGHDFTCLDMKKRHTVLMTVKWAI